MCKSVSSIFLGLILSCSIHAQSKEVPDDFAITGAVEDEYLFDDAVPLNDIDVYTTKGVVHLEGKVSNLLAKERAATVAKTVRGVRSVANRIEVEISDQISADTLADNIIAALIADPVTESYEVNVDAIGLGIVTLSGTVDSWYERVFAEKVVAGVSGVTSVVNNLFIDETENRMDHEILAEVEHRLRWDTLVDEVLVEVSVNEGKVELAGFVGSAAEKAHARLNAWVDGVKSVDDSGLEVEAWAKDEALRENKYVTKTDDEITGAIEDALNYDPRTFLFDITPHVANGWVTLRGEVNNLRAKGAATNIAHNTLGVIGVSDRMKVRSETPPTDAELKKLIEGKIERDSLVNSEDLLVEVRDRKAFVSGTVDTQFDKAHLNSLLYSVKGLEEVKNRVAVADTESVAIYNPYVWYTYPYPWSYETHYRGVVTADVYGLSKSDEETARDIAQELYWSPFVDHDDIEIVVEDGIATLVGRVTTRREKEAATENAVEGGARGVINNLIVEG